MVLSKERDPIKDIPFRKANFLPTSASVLDGYNNMVVSWENEQLIIFQDYGDGRPIIYDGYEELDRSLVMSDRECSLGHHDGWFVSVDRLGGLLLVQRLFKEELPNLDELNWKMPYDFHFLHKDKKLYYCVNIRTRAEHDYNFIVETKFSMEDVFSTKNIMSMLCAYPARLVYNDYNLDGLITRDLLVYRGFSYSDGVWRKGSIEIEDNQRDCPSDRDFSYDGDSIWLVEDLDEIMRREQS